MTSHAYRIRPSPHSLRLAAPGAESVKAWMWICARGTVSVEERGRVQTFNLDAEQTDIPNRAITWADFRDSIERWFAGPSTRPQVQRAHRDEGHNYGHATGTLRWLTGREAIAKGVPADAVPPDALDRESLFAEVELTDPDTIEQYRRGQLRTSSPFIYLGFLSDDAAETGERWPAVILELSLTANPVQKARQIPIDALAGVALSTPQPKEPGMDPTENAEAGAGTGAPTVEESIAALGEKFDALAAQLATMIEMQQAAAMADPGDEEPPTAPVEDEAMVQLSQKLKAAEDRAAALSLKVAEMDARSKLAPYNLDTPTSERFVKLALRDMGAFDEALALVPQPRRQVDAPPSPVINPEGTGARLSIDANAEPEARLAATNAAFRLQREAAAKGVRLSVSKALKLVSEGTTSIN